jgi:hypothetical protein
MLYTGGIHSAPTRSHRRRLFRNQPKPSCGQLTGLPFDEINSTWDNILGEFWNDPAGNAAEMLPQVEEAVNEVLMRSAEEEWHSFQ